MIVHELRQGTPEWHAYRSKHDNASDAPAMMGCSPYKTREQLIAELATGIVPEVDAATQRLYDSGHRFEALARPLAEEIMGEDLYPVTGSEGRLSASYDGLTMLEDKGWEHKRLNARLRAAMVEGCTGADLPMDYQVQMEQQCAVSGCERVLFTASDWGAEDNLIDARHCWYTPNPELRARILAGWEQLHKDVAAYVPPASAPAPVVAQPVQHLPVVFDMRVEGKLIACNLEQYKPAALAYIDSISTTLETDQDFADADANATYCRDSADKLEFAIEQALGQMGDINQALNTVRVIAAAFDAKALALEKLVKSRKDSIKLEQVQRGQRELVEHIAELNAAMPASYMPAVAADFGGAAKGKRTVEGLRNAVNTELARAKIEASNIANRIHVNLKALQESGLVVHDAAALVLKAPEDLAAIIATRLSAEQQRQDAERERISKEKLEADARAAQAAIAQAAQQNQIAQPVAADLSALVTERHAEAVAGADARKVIGAAQVSAAAAPEIDPDDTITLGQINARLSPIKLDAAGIEALGFTATKVRAAVHFPAALFPALCRAIATRAMEAATEKAEAA